MSLEASASSSEEPPMEDEPLGGTGPASNASSLPGAGAPPGTMPDAPPPPPPAPAAATAAADDAVGNSAAAATAAAGEYLPMGDSQPSSGPNSNSVEVEVIDPQTHGEGRSRHTDYCVLIPNVSAVRRRYSDFQWLYNRLVYVERPGAIVPIIPHKRTVGLIKTEQQFSHEFVQERRANLEVFIRRVVSHPQLSGAPSVSAFMKQEDELFAAAKKANDFDTSLSLSNHSDAGSDDAVDTSVIDVAGGSSDRSNSEHGPSGGSGGNKPGYFPRIRRLFAKAAIASGAELAKTEDEEVFVDIEKYAADLEVQVVELVKQSHTFAKATKTSSESMHSMAKAFSGLSENTYPNTDLGAAGRLASMLNNVAKGVLAMSAVTDEKSQEETSQVELKIQDFERDVAALKIALARRKEKLYALTTKLNKITKVGDKLDRMKDRAEPGSEVTIQNQEGTLIEAREAADAARVELEDVSARVKSEVERFRSVADDKLRKVVSELCGVQLRYNTKLNEGWSNLLTHVDTSATSGMQGQQMQMQVEPKVMSC